MNTATLVTSVRDPRSGEVHRPSEEVTIMSVIRNMDRTLMKVRWQTGGDCVLFPEELEEAQSAQ
jgi:DNA-binding IscR family transcriptional regulator